MARPNTVQTGIKTLRETLALGCNIVAMEGHADINLGHVTARIPGEDRMLMKPALYGLEEIVPDILITVDLDGNQLSHEGFMHHEAPIHTEIYKARPDVMGVVHTHPRFGVAFGASMQTLRPISHDGILFAKEPPPVFDLTTDLILTPELGREVAATLGDNSAMFLLNHGIVTVGRSVEEACVRAVFLERAAKIQLYATVYGNPRWTPDDEVDAKYQHVYGDQMGDVSSLIQGYWDYWARTVARKNRLLGSGTTSVL